MDAPRRALVVAQQAEAAHLAALLAPLNFSVQTVHGEDQCLAQVRRDGRFDLVLINSSMVDGEELRLLHEVRSASRAAVVVVVASYTTSRFVLQASQAGVHGFLSTPVSRADLEQVIEAVRAKAGSPVAKESADVYVENLGGGQFFLAGSPAMLEMVRQVKLLSRADVPVLITGESGVGKEVVATLLHKHSFRSGRPILKVNCAALPADLLESELFGYEAGAFTGAMKAKPGKFDLCDKGTILLDEIGEMSPQLQAKLLHVLQDGSFSRLGARVNTKVDVRVIAATNVDIEQAIVEKKFREDLYYRLNAFVLRVPPLRERRQEIPYLLRELAESLAATHRLEPVELTPRLIAAAVQHHWPGNLRELANFMKRYLIMRDETAALVELESKLCLRPVMSAAPAAPAFVPAPEPGLKSLVRSTRDQTEIRVIQEVLNQANWNRRIAAERLQISYKSLLQKIRHYDLAASA